MGDLLTDNVYTGNHRRSRSRSVSRRAMTVRGGSVSSKDIKVVDLSAMESPHPHRSSIVFPMNTKKTTKSTVATELSSSSEESQMRMRIKRAQDHIHQQQMLEEQRQRQKQQHQLARGRSRSQSRPRERESLTDNSSRVGRSRSRPRPTSMSPKESSLNRAKALLEKKEQKETAKRSVDASSSSRGRTRSPPPRGRSISCPRIRPDDLGSRIVKLVDDAHRHRSRSRPRQQQQQHKRDVNQQKRQQQRSSRSRSRPPSKNESRSEPRPARSRSRPREKKSERGEERRRSEKDNIRQHRGSLRQKPTSHASREKEHLKKELRRYVQIEETPQLEQLEHKHSRSSIHSSRDEHQKHHRHDHNGAENRDVTRKSAARHRSKSHMVRSTRVSRQVRSKSPYRPGLHRQNDATSKSRARSKSPYPLQKEDESSSPSSASAHISREDSSENNTQCGENEKLQKVDKNGCCIYHPFVQLQKKESGGGWTILSRVCAMCNKQAHIGSEQVSLVYVPGGLTDELPPRRNSSRPSIVKQWSVPSMSKTFASSVTVSVLESESESESDDSSSSSSTEYFSDADKIEDEMEENNSSSFESRRHSSRKLHPIQAEKASYDKIISSTDELLDELMYTEISMSTEESSEKVESDRRGKTGENKTSNEKEHKKSSLRGKRSSRRNTEPIDDVIDMSKVESALQQIRSRATPPRSRSRTRPHSDAIDPGKAKTPPPSHRITSKPPALKQQQPRPPPPPPPPYELGQSMAVLNPDPEPELIEIERMCSPTHHSYQHQMHGPPMNHIIVPEQQQVFHQHQSYAPELHHPPNSQQLSAPANKDTEWTKYAVKCSARQNEDASKKKERRKSKISGKVPDKLSNHESRTHLAVKDMPFTDTFGDAGIYTGQVNDDGRPDGKGSMKYNNGIFYEGTWTNGSQDEKAVTQYDRIRSGFTSWSGKGKVAVKSGQTLPWNAHKNDKHDENDKTNVRGMEWVDLNGDAGRYTGEVNNDNVPHGKGIMKFDFGLIAEGEWVHGVLKENPQDRALSAAELNARGQGADAVSVMSSARSLGRGGGMSIGTGVSGSIGQLRPPMMGGGMSVGPGISVGQGSVYGGMRQLQMMMQPHPQMIMQPQQMMMVQHQLPPPMMMMPRPNNFAMQNATLVAQQNAMMKASMYGGGSAFPSMALPSPRQQQNSQADPPVTEIKFS